MTFHPEWASPDNNLDIFFILVKTNGKYYNCLWGCRDNMIRNASCFESLNDEKGKKGSIL